MTDFTLDNFWKRRLTLKLESDSTLVSGWTYEKASLPAFTEAPLALSGDFGTANVDESSLLLVSAPGAVGKSTLARQIAFSTGAVYVDLAKAEPVGGNTLSGGLVKSGLYDAWKAGATAVLIDGLDEARLRVTQQAFEAFLSDVAEISKNRSIPTVLFGRTGAVQDAWLILGEEKIGLDVPVLEIGYFGREASLAFAERTLRRLRPDPRHVEAESKALALLLDGLRTQAEKDGDRFAGYAPVLQAVAERVAREGNPSGLVSEIENGEQLVTLQTIVSAILERERGKLRTLPFDDLKLADELYSPEEQLDRLAARVYQLPPPELKRMAPKDAETYTTALVTWVAEHPFLDGGLGTSSAVFDAVISARALKNPDSAGVALQRELVKGAAANPFLSEFYLPESLNSGTVYLPPEHIGIVYGSLRARLSLGDAASLSVEGVENAEEEESLRAEVEIALSRRNAERPRILRLATEQTGPIRLGPHAEDVEINVPHTLVQVGPGTEAVLVAPISIQCLKLVVSADRLIVEAPPSGESAAVYLEAEEFDGASLTSVPVLRGNVSLSASWPGVRSHPWTSFATSPVHLSILE